MICFTTLFNITLNRQIESTPKVWYWLWWKWIELFTFTCTLNGPLDLVSGPETPGYFGTAFTKNKMWRLQQEVVVNWLCSPRKPTRVWMTVNGEVISIEKPLWEESRVIEGYRMLRGMIKVHFKQPTRKHWVFSSNQLPHVIHLSPFNF